jgi:cyclopropane-fatty-acyl-phospholipid synthase
MARHFFTGGVMPSIDMLEGLDIPFELKERNLVSGTHYEKTAEAWLANLDRDRGKILRLFQREMKPKQAKLLVQRWRMFFLACVELFGFRGGEEWQIVHATLTPRNLGRAA